jgi:ABC-type multidrug transport system ATPase subunit
MKIELTDITKKYDGRVVIDGFTAVFEAGGAYLLTGPSGIGKTTLLRIMLGLEKADAGEISYFAGNARIHPQFPLHAGVVFQEDRLCEGLSAVDNVAMIFGTPDEESIRAQLSRILPADELDKPVRELSGGMRRRVCIVRACMAQSDLLVMDEPFNGLDDETRDRCIAYIREMRKSRTLVIVSHLTEGLDFCRRLTMD